MTDHELNLFNSVRKFVQPTETEWENVYACFTLRKIKKNEVLLEEGQVAQKIYYISNGCFRMFYFIEGEERCKDFQTEGQFTGSLYSYISGNPVIFNVAAIEDSEVLEISKEKLDRLFDTCKTWERFGRLYIEQ